MTQSRSLIDIQQEIELLIFELEIKEKLVENNYFSEDDSLFPNISKTDDIVAIFNFLNPQHLGFDAQEIVRRFSSLHHSEVIVSAIYLKRFFDNNGKIIEPVNFYKIFCVSIILANKYLDDDARLKNYYKNFDKVLKINSVDFNNITQEFLTTIDYKLFFNDDDIKEVMNLLDSKKNYFQKNMLEHKEADRDIVRVVSRASQEMAWVGGAGILELKKIMNEGDQGVWRKTYNCLLERQNMGLSLPSVFWAYESYSLLALLCLMVECPLSDREVSKMSKYKENVVRDIEKLPDLLKMIAIHKGLKKDTSLGKIFYYKRGFFSPSLKKGSLKTLKNMSQTLSSDLQVLLNIA